MNDSPDSQIARYLVPVVLLLVLLIFLTAIAGFALDRGLSLGPTPTLTRDRGPTPTFTPDFRATQNIQDLITQQAQRVAELGIDTPTAETILTPGSTPTPTPIVDVIDPPPTRQVTSEVQLPQIIVPGRSTNTPTPFATVTPTGIIIEPPTPEPNAVTLTAVAQATATAIANLPTNTPTTESIAPSDTPTPTPLPPLTLKASIKQATVQMREGPSQLYATRFTLPPGQGVTLRGRDESGEWLFVCCEGDRSGWLRQAKVTISGNEQQPNSPAGIDPNDVRLLPPVDPGFSPAGLLPTPTDPPAGDYPLFRRDSGAQARVETAYRPIIQFAWADPARAAFALSSPAVAAGQGVYVASEDSHLYSFEQSSGNQRWRKNFPQIINQAPAVHGSQIYVIDTDGNLSEVQDQGTDSVVGWTRALNVSPASAINLYSDILLVAGENQRIFSLDRRNGETRWVYDAPGPDISYPVVGNQLVYAANARIDAIDVYSATLVWSFSNSSQISAPPVYSYPGIVSLAELFVADTSGRVFALNANTGEEVWRNEGSGRITSGLAIDERAVYASGGGVVRALDRRNGALIWSADTPGDVLAGPIVGSGRLLIVLRSGIVQILDSSGNLSSATTLPTQAVGGPAVAGSRIFVPGADGGLYALREGGP